jgi:2-phospho-L-lactate guanylyltransferase (CobY/MobA/RfbA family)
MDAVRGVLLPVKDLRDAKKRLASLLEPEQRFALANAMLADTVRALKGVRLASTIFVVTNYPPAIRTALENGWRVIREDQQISESVSVDAASRYCASQGVTSLLRLPLDVPLVQAGHRRTAGRRMRGSSGGDCHVPRWHRHQRDPPDSARSVSIAFRDRQLR